MGQYSIIYFMTQLYVLHSLTDAFVQCLLLALECSIICVIFTVPFKDHKLYILIFRELITLQESTTIDQYSIPFFSTISSRFGSLRNGFYTSTYEPEVNKTSNSCQNRVYKYPLKPLKYEIRILFRSKLQKKRQVELFGVVKNEHTKLHSDCDISIL